MSDPFYVARADVGRLSGVHRRALLEDGTQIDFGVHGPVKAHYGLCWRFPYWRYCGLSVGTDQTGPPQRWGEKPDHCSRMDYVECPATLLSAYFWAFLLC